MRGGGPQPGGAHEDHLRLGRHGAPRQHQDQEGGAQRQRLQCAQCPRADRIPVDHHKVNSDMIIIFSAELCLLALSSLTATQSGAASTSCGPCTKLELFFQNPARSDNLLCLQPTLKLV